tara:strand:+ start:2844 stop:3506 length:663 start_codon:yes stop_codon:yes gene_type:complete
MLAIEVITDEIPPLKISDTGDKALSWMEEFKVYELPIVSESKFIGLITENDLLDMNTLSISLSEITTPLERPSVYGHDHIYSVISTMSEHRLSIVAVIDEQGNYLGMISQKDLIKNISSIAAFKEPGGILELEMNTNDYSLVEIANIIESNGGKVLSSYVKSKPDSTKIEVTVKTNKDDLSGILQTFSRYEYTIIASFDKSGSADDLKQRYDAFMHYLNI